MKKVKLFQTIFTSILLRGFYSIAIATTSCPAGQICNPLRYGNFEDLINAIIDFLIRVSIPGAAIMFVIAGFLFVTSGGDPERVRTARRMMIYTAVGFAVILLASGLIKVLQSILGGP